jgi:hypothetical protein
MRFVDLGPGDGGQLFAPATFLGDWTPYAGGTLSLDFKVFATGAPFFPNFIEFSGPAGTAVRNLPLQTTPGDWFNFSVPLHASDWSVSGNFNNILANVTQFRITMAISSNAVEVTGIDNVRLAAIPEPSIVAIVTPLVFARLLRRRRCTEPSNRLTRTLA